MASRTSVKPSCLTLPLETPPNPKLPPELEREIFEMAAHHSVECACRLVLVAKRVYFWVDPILHRVLVKCGLIKIPSVRSLRLVDDYRSGQTICSQLRKVSSYASAALFQDVEMGVVAEILSMSRNIQNLALWSLEGPFDPLASVITQIVSVQRFSINQYYLFQRQPHFDWTNFKNLTHLDLVIDDPELGIAGCKSLCSLPLLTHLALNSGFTEQLVPILLTNPSHLKLLVSFCAIDLDVDQMQDLRLVCLSAPIEWQEDWYYGAHGGLDFWSEAEAAQQRKARRQRARARDVSIDTPDFIAATSNLRLA